MIDHTPKWARKELEPPDLRHSVKCKRVGESLVYTTATGRKTRFWIRIPGRRHSTPSFSTFQNADTTTPPPPWRGPSEAEPEEEWGLGAPQQIERSNTQNTSSSITKALRSATHEPPSSDQIGADHNGILHDVNLESDQAAPAILTRANTFKDETKGTGLRALASLFSLYLFFLRVTTHPFAFLDRTSLISGRSKFAREEFHKRQSEHFSKIRDQFMAKILQECTLESEEGLPKVNEPRCMCIGHTHVRRDHAG